MIPKQSLIIFIILSLPSIITSQTITDFTYTQYTLHQVPTNKNDIHLHPGSSLFQNYQFPKACEVTDLLYSRLEQPIINLKTTNIDHQIAFLKEQVSQLMILSNQAELLKKHIRSLSGLKNDSALQIDEIHFKKLQESETKLKTINDQINSKVIQLEKLVYENMKNQQNPIFKQSSLNFEKKALQQRIVLFEQILASSISKKNQITVSDNENALNRYFTELQYIFNSQNSFIDTIDTLLKNHNELAIIKAKISSIKAQIKMYDLVISEKQECEKDYQLIKQKQKKDQKIIKLIEHLRLKKQEFNEPNKYCEGIMEKLTTRIKNLLMAYDYNFVCLEGLDELRVKRNLTQIQLNEAERKLNDLQISKGVSQFKKNFQHNRELIRRKIEKLKSLNLDPYYQNPTSIEAVIVELRGRIDEIKIEISNLPAERNKDWSVAERQIRKKVHQIEQLKGLYCKENDIYENKSRQLEERMYKLEEQEEHNNLINRLQKEKVKQLQEVKVRMAQVQGKILSFMN